MKRFSEKVKDIVDVRSYRVLPDLLSDPSGTISNYHFSDATSDLMARWLDEVSAGAPAPRCRAIAGYRGVGKSHFLAAISAIASRPEVRSSISESHVSSAAQRLLRRHYPVINVRRGTRTSLVEELIAAVSQTFDQSEEYFTGSVESILEKIKVLAGELTAVLIIDTAADRSAPVERNDGDVLAEISTICSRLSIFVGLALDDDIAEADGSNLAISQSFVIDYLDPEHLHKVVNSLIFPKRTRMQSVLSNVYSYFRDSVPHFSWSEQRFISLYPLHPAMLDLAPFIRAYLPNFALLGFAATAGEKILNRPVDSLVGYEEIFDTTEPDLRKVADLESAFAAYDGLVSNVISELPVTERHQAKLILKTLLIHSLSGQGSTVDRLVGAMMIVDNGDLEEIRDRIGGTLDACAKAQPNTLIANATAGVTEYYFKIGSNKLSIELDELANAFGETEVEEAYFRAVAVRFPELNDAIAKRDASTQPSKLIVKWRGSLRYGRVFVHTTDARSFASSTDQLNDWDLHLRFSQSGSASKAPSGSRCSVEWIADQLTTEEKRILAANQVLRSNSQFRAKYGDQLSALIQTYSRLVDVLAERTLVGDAKLVIDGFDYNFSDAARESSSLGEMMSVMLEPLFESIYYEHPYFAELLTDEVVENYLKEVCGNSGKHSSELYKLAVTFGEPLGLIRSEGGKVAVRPKNELGEVPSVQAVLKVFDQAGGRPVPAGDAFRTLGGSPLGLSRQAARLILASMASIGMIEFVTADNERISGRSLDLKLDWGVIDSIAKPSFTKISREQLIKWAGVISGDASLRTLDRSDDRSKVFQALVEISAQWEKRNPVKYLASIPEINYNAAIWRDSNQITEGYSEMVATIDEALVGSIDLAVCIERISEEFLDRPATFHAVRSSMQKLESFGAAHLLREKIRRYLVECEISEETDLEGARSDLIPLLKATEIQPTETSNRELGYAWEKFQRLYVDAYLAAHKVAESVSEPGSWFESVAGKDRWRRFSSILGCKAVKERFGKPFREMRRRLKNFGCLDDPSETLAASPRCGCLFRISDARKLDELANNARLLINEADWFFERLIVDSAPEIKSELEKLTVSELENEVESRSRIMSVLESEASISDLSEKEFDLLVSCIPANSLGEWWHSAPSIGSDPAAASLFPI